MNPALATILFWTSLALLFYAFPGYPLLMRVLARGRGHGGAGSARAPAEIPTVSVVIVAHNEAERIGARVRNLLDSQYPADRIEVVVVSDGSTDDTAASTREVAGVIGGGESGPPEGGTTNPGGTGLVVPRLRGPGDAPPRERRPPEGGTTSQEPTRVRVIELPERRGKAHGLNAGVAQATGEIVVFTDARQAFTPETVPALVAALADPRVGAVSGALEIGAQADAVSSGVDAYWRLEKALRHAESQLDSCIGCTGAVYAIRLELFETLPEDTILDDVVVPMRIAVKGHRVLFEPQARALDPQSFAPELETRRKRRTLAGNFQMLCRYPGWLLPWRNRLWWQLISHKYLRLAGPVLLVLACASNAALLSAPFYRATFAAQLLCYTLAVIGILLPRLRTPLLSLPAGFLFLNLQTVLGGRDYLRGAYTRGWSGQHRKS